MAEQSSTAVADLVVKLHSNIDSIHQCIQSLSDTSSHDAELERLETEREQKIEGLRAAHANALKELSAQREKEAAELAAKRKKEEEELEAQRQREYEELMARRRREDEERKAKVKKEEEERARLKSEEDERRERERVDTERSLQDRVEAELEKLEDEMEKRVEEGKKALKELDETRKAINAQIDAALNKPTVIPTIHFRSRAKTLRAGEQKDIPKGGGHVPAPATAQEPIVNGLKDIPAESDTKSTDVPRGLAEHSANKAEETPIVSKAEYDHSPVENTNIAVSDANAELNATKNRDTVDRDESETVEARAPVEDPNVGGSEDTPLEPEIRSEQALTEHHDLVEPTAKDTPTESEPHPSARAIAAIPEVREIRKDVSSQAEFHADVPPGQDDSVSSESKDGSHELESTPSENTSADNKEEATPSDAKDIHSDLENDSSEDVHSITEESQGTETEGPVREADAAPVESEVDAASANENHDHMQTPAHPTTSKAGWFSRSLYRLAGVGNADQASSEPQSMETTGKDSDGFENDDLTDRDDHTAADPNPGDPDSSISEDPTPAPSHENAAAKAQRANVENEHEHVPQFSDADALHAEKMNDNAVKTGHLDAADPESIDGVPQDVPDENPQNDHDDYQEPEASDFEHVEYGQAPIEMTKEHVTSPALESSHQDHSDRGSVERDVQDSADQVSGANVDHDQDIISEARSPPLEEVEAQNTGEQYEDARTDIEENGVDPGSQTTAVQAPRGPQEDEVTSAGGTREHTAFHPDEPESVEPESTTLTHTPLPHVEQHGIEAAEHDELQNDPADSVSGPADSTQDILDGHASRGPALHSDKNKHGHDDSTDEPWTPAHGTPSQGTETSQHEIPNDRPSTPAQGSNTFDYAPTTPQHLIQESHYGLAESPNTVLDADDLFDDDDENEDEEDADGYGHGQEVEHDASQENAAWLPDQTHEDSLAHRQHEDNHSLSDYSKATPGERRNPGLEDAVPYPSQEPDAGLHIRTHTADTIPSFESFAQSDGPSTPTSPSEAASSPFVESPHDGPNIRSSWQDNSALQGSDPMETHQELKPQASPMQAEFGPYNSQTYPNYISPRASQVNLGTETSPRNHSFAHSGAIDAPQSHNSRSNKSPSWQTKNPRLPSLNTSQASQFSEGRPFDSPVSSTRSDRGTGAQTPSPPTPSKIPRRATDRTVVASRTPVSSPSIPGNSFFQKTRSLFESASTQSSSPPSANRPLSGIFTASRGSPSPSRRSSRPSSLLLSSPGGDSIVPRSLDKDGRPPSPVFTLPAKKPAANVDEGSRGVRQRTSNPFLDGLSKLVGSGGLEDSVHNPNRREREPLLAEGRKRDGY